MADPPVVHLPDRDYNDQATRRDWQKQGFAVTAAVDGHPMHTACPQCTASPEPDHLAVLADELLALCTPGPSYGPDRARWERNVKGVIARIFRLGMASGWDKAVAPARKYLMDVDPRELTPGYAFASRNLGTAWGVLRDGKREVWRCAHKPHAIPTQAGQCAQAEQERRLAGAQEVLRAVHCRPCGAFWDLGKLAGRAPDDRAVPDDASWLLRGLCPRCEVPAEQVTIAVLERREASVR